MESASTDATTAPPPPAAAPTRDSSQGEEREPVKEELGEARVDDDDASI
jgi:hypothetical protein